MPIKRSLDISRWNLTAQITGLRERPPRWRGRKHERSDEGEVWLMDAPHRESSAEQLCVVKEGSASTWCGPLGREKSELVPEQVSPKKGTEWDS